MAGPSPPPDVDTAGEPARPAGGLGPADGADGADGAAQTTPDGHPADRSAGDSAELGARSRARRRRATGVAFVTYAALALAAYWPIWPGDPDRITGCACGDQVQQVWFLAWTPFALAHGHDPFVTHFMDVPTGVNLANNVLMPALGLVGAPLTVLFGPVSTLSLGLWLAFPLSATACFVLLRRWVGWAPAAFVGGLFYGFSPYVVGQATGHLNLAFVPIPPLVLLCFDELLVRQRRRAVVTGTVLGLLLAAQFFVTTEVFANSLVMAALGTILLVVARPRLAAAHARHTLVGLGTAAALCAVLIAYPLYVQLRGPDRFTGSAHGTYPFQADLLGPVVPTIHQLLAPAALQAVSDRFILGDATENGSYLGIPLLVVLVAVAVWRWRMPIVRFAAAMMVAAEVLALGPALTVDGHTTGVALPDRLLDHVPLFSSFVDARFSLQVDLFAAILLAVGTDQLRALLRARASVRQASVGQTSVGQTSVGRAIGRPSVGRWPSVVAAAVAVAALVPLVPDWPYPSAPATVPAFFSSPALQRIPAGSVALTYPYTQDVNDQGMFWQATAAMPFRLLGGYALVPGPTGTASDDAYPSTLTSVPATLTADDEGVAPGAVVPGATTATPAEVRRFLRRYDVDTVLADPVGARPAAAVSLLQAAMGARPSQLGGLDVWFGVRQRLGQRHRDGREKS